MAKGRGDESNYPIKAKYTTTLMHLSMAVFYCSADILSYIFISRLAGIIDVLMYSTVDASQYEKVSGPWRAPL
jgi:hypothetical protein